MIKPKAMQARMRNCMQRISGIRDDTELVAHKKRIQVGIELQRLVDDGLIEAGEVRYRRDPETLERVGLIIKYENEYQQVNTIEIDFDIKEN